MSASASPTPALSPPPGVTSNFEHPESLFKWEILTLCLCLISTTIVFGLRTYVRLSIKRSFILEDYFCTLGWILEVLFLSLLTLLMYNHGGEHQWDLTKPQARWVLEWTNIVNTIYSPAVLFVKVAILLLYRRVFVVYKGNSLDYITQLLIFVVFGFEIAGMIIKIWECVPRAMLWDKELEGHCVNFAAFMISSGVFNTATDVIILVMPIRAVWNLQMTTKTKIGIVSIFSIGLTAPVFSLIGMIVRIKIAASKDVTFNQPKIHLFAAAEIASGLLCLCMPTLAALKPSHRQQFKRPSISILNGASNSRRTPKGNITFSGKHVRDLPGGKRSLDEQDLFEFDDVRQERVVTRIDGGESGEVDAGGGGGGEGRGGDAGEGIGARWTRIAKEGVGTAYPINEDRSEEGEEGRGLHTVGGEEIMKTVKIEQMQTYV